MCRTTVLRAALLLTVINSIHTQYYDFFQAFQPFVQGHSGQPINIFNDHTTRRTRPKEKLTGTDGRHDEHIRKLDKIPITDNAQQNNRHTSAAEQTERNKQTRRKLTSAPAFDINFYTTTQRAIRKTTRTPSTEHNQHKTPKQESQNKQSSAIIFFGDNVKNLDNFESNSKMDSNTRDRPKPVSKPNNRKTISQPVVANNEPSAWYDGRNSVAYTTRPSYYETTKSYSYLQNNNKNKNNYYTTHNPLLNRPGVKPADQRGPPITNRPVTQRPDRPGPPRVHVEDDLNVTPEVISGPDEDFMSAVERKRYIEIAEEMCDRYKSLDTKQVQAIPLVPSPQPVKVNVSSCLPTTIPLVVGGKVVSIQEFPHMALLGWRKTKNAGYSWKCGGSLLSERFVLTAAHCAYQDRDDYVIAGPPRLVQLGSSYLDDPKAVFRGVAAVIRHPKYKLPQAYYDLAIVKMAVTVTFSKSIKPACLGTPPPAHRPVIATGWGRTEFGGSQSHELRSVSVPVWEVAECRAALGVSIKIPYGPSADSQLCAGEQDGGKDTCQGDSGGPAQIQEGCSWRVVAVTSVGRFCGAAGTPAIYATVQHAFISAVVFGQDTTRNNNHASNTPAPTNDRGSGSDEWTGKRKTEQTSSRPNQQNNNFYQQNGMTGWNRKPNGDAAAAVPPGYGNNREKNYNWNSERESNYDQNNRRSNNYDGRHDRPDRNDYGNNNYNNPQTTESHGSNSWRENDYYNPASTGDAGHNREFYNNYSRNNNYKDGTDRRQDYISDGGRQTSYNSDGNVWWT